VPTVPSVECPPPNSPLLPKKPQDYPAPPTSESKHKSLSKQDNWNLAALKKAASSHKFVDNVVQFDDMSMLSISCDLVCKATFHKYFTSIAGAMIVYLSAKIQAKYVEDNFPATEPQEKDRIRIGLVHCFGIHKRQCRKRKRGENDQQNQEPQPVADNETKTVSNRSPKRLFFLVPEKVLEDVRTQFSFDPAITKQEFLCCLGWLLSRTAWLKTIYTNLLKKYPNAFANLPNPFEDYEKALQETIIGNNARISVIPRNTSQSNLPRNTSQFNNSNAIQQNHSTITNFNFIN